MGQRRAEIGLHHFYQADRQKPGLPYHLLIGFQLQMWYIAHKADKRLWLYEAYIQVYLFYVFMVRIHVLKPSDSQNLRKRTEKGCGRTK